MLIWVSQWSQCFKICVAQHWGGRRHISGGKTVWSINLMIFPENSRETVSVSMICDEYCNLTCGSPRLPVAGGLRNVFLPRGFLVSGFTFNLISPLSSHCHSLPTGNLSPTTVWVLEAEFRCKCETRSSTVSTGNPAKSLSSLSLWLESSIARASSWATSYLVFSALLLSSSNLARCFALARSRLISSSHFCAAIFNLRASFSAWSFFLRIELLLALDILVDSLDGNNFNVWSLFQFETLISDTIVQSLSTFLAQHCWCLLFTVWHDFTQWLNNSILPFTVGHEFHSVVDLYYFVFHTFALKSHKISRL